MRVFFSFVFLCFFFVGKAQENSGNYRTKTLAVTDTIIIDTLSISSKFFKVFSKSGSSLKKDIYRVDFRNSLLILLKEKEAIGDSVIVEYLRFPEHLTKTRQVLDSKLIVPEGAKVNQKYSLEKTSDAEIKLFDGLNTSGSLSRGVTVGNNQNAVVNSQLDLQISGKISEQVTLLASIKDANIPLQESGYSQRLDEFDQIFINVEGPSWKMHAGDINLQNSESYFMNFTKKIQGLSVETILGNKERSTRAFVSGAIVRGNFAQSQFQGQEGNQGPYKLKGPNEELFILVVSGSERVYVNGILLKRGENHDYIIDYNAGEIIFTPRYPITSDMRILIEYQYTNNNFTRFLAYGGVTHSRKSFSVGTYFYSESDSKNQPLQQDLSSDQVSLLRDAGDNRQLMVAPSEVQSDFSENRILYRKDLINGEEVFVFSNDPNDELFQVRFTDVGTQQGNYILANTNAIGKIYEYVSPLNGVPQGNFAPITQLNAPDKLQMAVVNASYQPTDKTKLLLEGAWSNRDINLFSNLDDKDNNGLAARISFKQQLYNKQWKARLHGTYNYVGQKFRNLEGIYNVEFNRDWNLPNLSSNLTQDVNGAFGDQNLLSTGVTLSHPEKGNTSYIFEHLTFKNFASGNRHSIKSDLLLGPLRFKSATSYLNNKTNTTSSKFFRSYSLLSYSFKKSWAGLRVNAESNKQTEHQTGEFTPISQRFSSYNPFIGIGDSTKIFLELGFKRRINDSVQSNKLIQFNTSNTYYLKSKLIENKNTGLSAFISFRDFKFAHNSDTGLQSLNSRFLFRKKLWEGIVQGNTAFETNSGTIAQQEFTYLEVEPGQGAYTWIDYNNNGIQELDEFEIAQFQDQGKYVRILLPNQIFVPTYQNRFSQTLSINPGQWSNQEGFKKILSHFYSQTSYLIDSKNRRRENNFDLNPFSRNTDNLLGLNHSLRNVLFFNRGKQKFTTSYTYLISDIKNQLSTGSQQNKSLSHQLQFVHKINSFWLANLNGVVLKTESISDNFLSRNFLINSHSVEPKLSYLFDINSRFEVFYSFANKENTLSPEHLEQHKFGVSFAFTRGQKHTVNGGFNYYKNDFAGNAFSPAGYNMLQGLQPGNNITWNLFAQKKITSFLDLNLSYFGRKSESSSTIHTGSIQLKAYF